MTTPTLFLTGGTGFLGHHLVPRLVAQGYCVRLLVRREPVAPPPPGVAYVRGDVTDAGAVRRGMEGCQVVVHGAGLFRFWGSEEDFQQINVQGTKNVVQAAIQAGVARLVHISTIAVVGQAPAGQPITEETVCAPLDAYQRSKLAGETVVRAAPVPSVILRPGAFYGPGSTYGFNRLFIQDPMRGVRIQVDGGRRLIFPVFVPDVAWAVGAALEMVEAEGVYNICDQPRSHQEINRVVSQLLGISPFRISVPRAAILGFAGVLEFLSHYTHHEPFFPLNLRHYVFNDWPVSSARARGALGFEPTPMEEGLRQTVAWFKHRAG
ncbi:MAG: NAD-dependent epimerase/dehydratase family protein [Anaerolineales bacterium]|nr:NAD-dependent epimerase/dehydratase family protein [Anaerolineales bacterium]